MIEPGTFGYVCWKKTNVFAQPQKEFYSVAILLSTGDITAVQMRILAQLIQRLGRADGIQTTVDQGLLLTWVHQAELPFVYEELVKYGLAAPGKGTIHQVISCPGAEICRSGLTRSKTMAKTLSHVLFQMYGEVPEDLMDVSIRVGGCSDNCSQPQLGTLGFQGSVSQEYDQPMPCYSLYIGGKSGEDPKLGEFVIQLPAKRVPKAVMDLVDWYRSGRYENNHETFAGFLERMGKELIRRKLEPLTQTPPFDQERDLYYDWGASEPYKNV